MPDWEVGPVALCSLLYHPLPSVAAWDVKSLSIWWQREQLGGRTVWGLPTLLAHCSQTSPPSLERHLSIFCSQICSFMLSLWLPDTISPQIPSISPPSSESHQSPNIPGMGLASGNKPQLPFPEWSITSGWLHAFFPRRSEGTVWKESTNLSIPY